MYPGGRQALRTLDLGRRGLCRKLVLPGSPRHHAGSDVAGAAQARLAVCVGLHGSLGSGHWLINLYGLGGKVEAFRASYAQWGALIILLKGLTPIPYKLVTITSGFAGFDIWLFVLFSIITRGGRFFIAALVLNRYGDWIRTRIEQHLGLVVLILVVALVLGFFVAFRMI